MYKTISQFRGLAQHIDPAQLSEEYAVDLYNIDTDNPEGAMSVRHGYTKKYSQSYTDIISSYEFTIEQSGDVIFLFNDNGTFKYYKNGTYVAALTLPVGATLENTFTNNYFGWRDAIRVTTGAGATNYILWFGYTKRDAADNDGLFGDVLDDNGTYRLLRSQLIQTHGNFPLSIRSVVYLSGNYYISFFDSKWIEKRNSNYQLVDLWAVNEDQTVTAADNGQVSLATDGTYLYAATTGGVYQLDPNTHKCSAYIDHNDAILDICCDGTEIFFIDDNSLHNHAISGFTLDDTSDGETTVGITSSSNISCDNTETTGYVYISDDVTIEQRAKNALSTADASPYDLKDIDAGMDAVYKIQWLDADQVFIACSDGDENHYIVDLDSSNVSTKNAHYQDDNLFVVSFIFVGGTTLRAVDGRFGMIKNLDAATLVAPEFMTVSISELANTSGLLQSGSYFYKICAEDVDGQVYTLSDPIVSRIQANNKQTKLRITATGDRSESNKFGEFYRIKYIHLFRGYTSGADAEISSTNYNLLKTIDINDPGWSYNSDYDLYYFDYTDNTVQSSISPTTYFELSGISENTKPRHVNGKYFTWFENQLHLANLYSDGEDYPSQIVRSPLDAPDAIAFYDIYKFQEYGGEEILGISNAYGRSVVFKERIGGIFKDASIENIFMPGLSSDRGFVNINDIIYYNNISGVFVLQGYVSTLISQPIRTSHSASGQDHSSATMFHFDNFDRLIIAYDNGDYSFMYSLKNKTWHKYSSFWFRNFIKNSDQEFIGVTDSNIYKLFTGTDDDGTGIQAIYQSGIIRLEGREGFDNEISLLQARFNMTKFAALSTAQLVIYSPDGTALKTLNLSNTSGNNVVQPFWLSSLWREAIYVYISVGVSAFKLSSLTFKHEVLGESAGA